MRCCHLTLGSARPRTTLLASQPLRKYSLTLSKEHSPNPSGGAGEDFSLSLFLSLSVSRPENTGSLFICLTCKWTGLPGFLTERVPETLREMSKPVKWETWVCVLTPAPRGDLTVRSFDKHSYAPKTVRQRGAGGGLAMHKVGAVLLFGSFYFSGKSWSTSKDARKKTPSSGAGSE